jgi:hypothetical protein
VRFTDISSNLIASSVAAGLLSDHRVLICDRDRKWSREVRRELDDPVCTSR